ncbi:MAG: phage minor head protein, partial [Chloroflexota bacterium]
GDDFWDDEESELLAILMPRIVKGAQVAGAATITAMELNYALGIDWTQPSAAAVAWARRHAGDLVKGITDTTKGALHETLAAWLDTPGSTMGDLFGQLQEHYAFSEARAQAVAITEITRSYAEGEAAACRSGEELGLFTYRKSWRTCSDELVCPRCSELDGQTADGIDGTEWTEAGEDVPRPPQHPRCRCFVTMEPIIPEEE